MKPEISEKMRRFLLETVVFVAIPIIVVMSFYYGTIPYIYIFIAVITYIIVDYSLMKYKLPPYS